MVTTNRKQGQGVIPDIIIEPTQEEILSNEDVVLKPAIAMCRKQIKKKTTNQFYIIELKL